ncbi:hypothetical protein [Catenovulum agarivorans]|uniref:hypothetical protein n=1 Tax=Catenovulum agarivorans TaxID=1172192 RepID=UPI0004B9E937|nr:hypothetical protein [Catenovulum agarivorans]
MDNLTTKNQAKREWAIASCDTLISLDLLNSEEQNKFADGLYQQTDKFGLPEKSIYYRFAYLNLPKPQDVDTLANFKKYIYTETFPIRGKENGFSLLGGKISLLDEIAGASRPHINIWGQDDIKYFAHKLIEWWDTDKQWVEQEKNEPKERYLFFGGDKEFNLRFNEVVKILSSVVLPKLDNNEQAIILELTRIIVGMEELGINTLKAEAAFCDLKPESVDIVLNKIETNMLSCDIEVQRDALLAIPVMLKTQSGKEYQTDLTEMLGQFITWNNTNMLTQALWVVIDIVKNNPQSFTSNLDKKVQNRLLRLLTETNPSTQELNIEFEFKINLRSCAVRLASALKDYYSLKNMTIPNVVNDWFDISKSDIEFSEVRNAWEKY